MARETKVGLLIALGVVLLIGVIISDHLAVTRPQQAQADTAAAVAQFAPAAQQGIQPVADPPAPQNQPPAGDAHGSPRDPSGTPSAPRLIAPDRFAEPNFGPPSRQKPETQAADARSLLADLPSPPTAWRKIRPLETTPAPSPDPGPIHADAEAHRDEASDLLAPAPVRQAGSEFLHDVARGDTLASVAIKYYHDSAYADSLLAANPEALDPQGRLTPGTRLIIPNRAGHIDPPTPQTPKPAQIAEASPDQKPAASIADEPPTALMSTGLFVPITGINAAGDAPGTLAPITAHAATHDAPAQTITVEAGDSLSKLAERHLGTQRRYLELFEANRDVLDSPDKVVVGMELKLPPGGVANAVEPTPTAVSRPRGSDAPPARPAAQTYTVQAGDNLSNIAEATLGSRDRWRELYDANRDRLDTPDRVRIGQELRIPG